MANDLVSKAVTARGSNKIGTAIKASAPLAIRAVIFATMAVISVSLSLRCCCIRAAQSTLMLSCCRVDVIRGSQTEMVETPVRRSIRTQFVAFPGLRGHYD